MYEDFEPEDQPADIRDRNVPGSRGPRSGGGGGGGGPRGRFPRRGGNGENRPPAPRAPRQRVEFPQEALPARDLLTEILTKMGLGHFDIEYVPRQEGEYFEITGPELGMLIGRHGKTLEALNLIFNNILNAGVKSNRRYYTIDAEGYRARRADQLKSLALTMLERTIREKKPQRLEPMLPSERKTVHLALADTHFVRTERQGAEPERRVVIHPK